MKYIKLSQGKRAIIDDEDYEYLSQWKWCFNNDYAKRSVRQPQESIVMHRVITNCPKNKQVDHINGNTLDNRKENLRVVSLQQNVWNRKKSKNTTSKYKGVSFCNRHKKWLSQIMFNWKTKHLGYYKTEIEAAKAYNEAAIKYHGEYARLNNV